MSIDHIAEAVTGDIFKPLGSEMGFASGFMLPFFLFLHVLLSQEVRCSYLIGNS
jgi:hypothetical protein